jgi:hypothetical protein
VIRRSVGDFLARLREAAPDVAPLDLKPGDAWSREGGLERRVLQGSPPARVATDYIHPYLGTGERWCPAGRPSTEETFRRDLPALTARRPGAATYVQQPVLIEVVGADAGTFTVDFREPGSPPKPGDAGAPYGLRIRDEDWKDLFERRIPWQVMMVSDRLAVTRVRHGAPPEGLHFVFALQAVFP